jgi:hypothetical protein
MANQEHLEILAKGVEAWNEWRKANPNIRPDLSRVRLRSSPDPWSFAESFLARDADVHVPDMCNANFNDVTFRSANLCRVNLKNAKLVGADLASASLCESLLAGARFGPRLHGDGPLAANLTGADLTRADLTKSNLTAVEMKLANLTGACLVGSWLVGANLYETRVVGADFDGARIGGTAFGNIDLRLALNLDTVEHAAPSTIGVDTVYASKGQIPDCFLRGCGVPENFITYMRSLTVSAFDFYSCFISYSTKDQDFADRLHADLQARGVRCWFAPRDIQGGRKIHEQIDEAIRVYDKLLLILSDGSMNSPWVKTEIANARARETQQKRQMLFPITLVPFDRIHEWKCFDADAGIDTAREIREYYVPDFSRWKDHDAYTAVLERLVRDLKARPVPTPSGYPRSS